MASTSPKKLRKLKFTGDEPELLDAACVDRAQCQECNCFASATWQFVYPYVPEHWTRKFIFVTMLEPQSHASSLLKSCASKAGLNDADIVLIRAMRCIATPKVTMKQIRACRPFLLQAIKDLAPQYIMGFGEEALKALTNSGALSSVAPQRGRWLDIPGVELKAQVTYDPQAVIDGNYSYQDLIIADLQRIQANILQHPRAGARICNYGPVAIDTEFTPTDVLDVAASIGNTVQSGVSALDNIVKASFIIGHAIPVDIDSLVKLGVAKETWVQGRNIQDSLLLARLANENKDRGSYGVEALMLADFNTLPWKYKTDELDPVDSASWPAALREERCQLDAWAAWHIARRYAPFAKGPIELLHRIEMTLHRMYHAGVFVDYTKFLTYQTTIEQEFHKAKDLASRLALSYGIDSLNDTALRTLLFKKMKLSVVDKTETGLPAVNKVTLKELARHDERVNILLEYVKYEKLYSTYSESFREKLQDTSPRTVNGTEVRRLPVRINPLGARTGRRTSEKPNLQNTPEQVNTLFCSRFLGGKLIRPDFSKLEVIIMAWLAKDEELLTAFTSKDNGYIVVGNELFGRHIQEKTKDYKAAKSIVLSIPYGKQPKTLAYELWFDQNSRFDENYKKHTEVVTSLYEKFIRRFSKLQKYLYEREREVIENQQVEVCLGQVRRLPCPLGRASENYWHIRNQAYNTAIQGTAAYVTGCAMIDLEAAILNHYNMSYLEYHERLMSQAWPEVPILCNEVHDEIWIDVPALDQDKTIQALMGIMAEVPTLRKLVPTLKNIPLQVSIK